MIGKIVVEWAEELRTFELDVDQVKLLAEIFLMLKGVYFCLYNVGDTFG